jgi:hypothetical protein
MQNINYVYVWFCNLPNLHYNNKFLLSFSQCGEMFEFNILNLCTSDREYSNWGGCVHSNWVCHDYNRW